MKKIFYILGFILNLGLVGYSQGQFRGNLSEGPGNSIIFSARPMDNVSNIGFSTIEYFVRYEKTKPEFTYSTPVNNTTNFPGMGSWQVLKKEKEDANYFYDYFLYTAPSPITGLRNYSAGQVYEVISVVVSGAQVKDLGLTLVHHEQEDPFYYVFTNDSGLDSRPNSLTDYFYPSTSVIGSSPNRIYSQDIILPVEFLSFYAVKSGNDARLSWNVDGDETNAHFEVMRSVNGRNFTSVQKVNALENGRSNNVYEATDINLSKLNSREVYYQIAQFDKDGTKTLSPVRKLSVDGLGKSVTAFPNPAKTTTKVVVDAPESGRGSLIMRDASGRQVQVMNAQFFKGINQFDMNVGALPSGEYNIQVSGGGLNETIKLTKIK